MATTKIGANFKNAQIVLEDGEYKIIETIKVAKNEFNYKVYDLLQEIEKLSNIEGLTISFSKDVELDPLEVREKI